MLRSNYARIQNFIIRNFLHSSFNRKRSPVPVQKPHIIALLRRYAQYQFRGQKTAYYPDRQLESKRMNDNYKSNTQLIVNQNAKQMPKDFYYKILGVHRHASTQQIKHAFYALAKRFHPDSTHSEQKLKHFQELSNAYTILTDETKRLEYDQLGMVRDEQAFLEQASKPKTIQQSQRPQQPKVTQFIKKIQQMEPTQKQEDVMKVTSTEPELELTFLEATIGCKKRTDLSYLKKCETCNGKSQLMANRDMGNELCRRCNGTGQIVKKTPTFTSVNVCTTCKGKRYVNRNNCDTCENRGYVLNAVQVLVNVPSGSLSGDVVPIENPNTKQRVNYRLTVQPSDYFRRVGNDIHSEKFLNISDAILGGTFKVRGLYEDIDLKVAAGTQSHTTMVLKNKGVRTRAGIGSHIITLIVRIPKVLTVKQRQLVLALSKTENPVYERSPNVNS